MDASITEYSKNWELLTELNVGGRLPVLKYRSKRTGLTVTIGKAESPIVNGYFCLATEAKTADGLPHTLEHLVFLGRSVYLFFPPACYMYTEGSLFLPFFFYQT